MLSSLLSSRPRLHKRRRRTATTVLAGDFDPRPPRDVLTSLLNGVPRYDVVEKTLEEESKRAKKKERREKDKERLRAKRAEEKMLRDEELGAGDAGTSEPVPASPLTATIPATAHPATNPVTPFLHEPSGRLGPSRPSIFMASAQRSVSITPPPMPSSPASTPGPSMSSSTSRLSSKRPHTPDDDEDMYAQTHQRILPPRVRKKRASTRKGWKGWVEGSPPPSDRLINLDEVKVIRERRTRSGRNFDA